MDCPPSFLGESPPVQCDMWLLSVLRTPAKPFHGCQRPFTLVFLSPQAPFHSPLPSFLDSMAQPCWTPCQRFLISGLLNKLILLVLFSFPLPCKPSYLLLSSSLSLDMQPSGNIHCQHILRKHLVHELPEHQAPSPFKPLSPCVITAPWLALPCPSRPLSSEDHELGTMTCSLSDPQGLEQCLVYSRHSIPVCLIK